MTWPGEKEGDLDHGINSVLRVLDGCAIEQNFSGGVGMHLRGKTLSIFDTASDKWKQTWLDNDGGYLNFTCEFKDGQMILAPRPCGATVRRSRQRELGWSWEASADGGKTWQINWPIHYRRQGA